MKASFNSWIMGKILQYLTGREGFTSVKSEYSADGYRAVVEDAFGFRYELEIKAVGRKQLLPEIGIERTIFDIRSGGA